MIKIVCPWCHSSNVEKKFSNENEIVKYQEYVCQDCKKSSWQQADYDINQLLFLEKREFFMLDPDSFPFLGR